MVLSCSVNACTNRYKKRTSEGPFLHFYRFPFKRPAILEQWIRAIRRDNWEPTAYSFVCSEHFLESDYQIRPGADRKLLKEDAVPSVFIWSSPLRTAIKQEPELEMADWSIKTEKAENNLVQKSDKCIQSISNNKNTGIQCKLTTPECVLLRREVKILRQRLKRKQERIRNMKELIGQLKQKVKIPNDY